MTSGLRVLVAKVGLDGHETGAKLVTRLLRDAGLETIYFGTKTTVTDVVNAAIDEDVDVVGISLLSGIHLEVARELVGTLREMGSEVPVIFGGVIPPSDAEELLAMGVASVFGPGSSSEEIVAAVRALAEGYVAAEKDPPGSHDL